MAKWQDTFKKLKKRKEEVDKTSSPSEIKQIDTSYDNVTPSIRDVNGLRNPGSTYNTLDVSSVLLGTYATKVQPTVTNPTLYGMNSKPTVTTETETVEPTVKSENKTSTVNADGYKETGKTYGDYWYQEYGKRKDEKIYEKDGKYYLYSNGTYQDVDKVSYMTDKKTDKKTLQEAKKEGYKGSKSSLAHISDQLKLDTENLSEDEYKEYESDLKRQQEKHEKELARKSEVQYSGAGLKGSLGTLKTYASNVGNKVDDEIATPLKYAKDNYEVGKLNNELALEYYNKMEGKSNKVDKLKKKVDTYNKFNKDLLEEPGALGTAIQQANTQVESLKHQGVAATVLGLGGATAGALLTRTPQGALAGAKAGGMAGYTLGSTPYTYKLEAGNQYQTLTEMGVPDKVAKKYSKITGVVNAGIESGENILDLATLGISAAKGTTAVSKEAVNSMVEDYGESTVKKWLTKKFGEESANKIVNVAKTGAASYVQNIGSEALEESLQESTSVGTERLATKEAGIERKATARDDLNRILEAGKTAAISTAFTSPLTSIGGSIVTHTINNVDAKLQNKVRNKTITETELNNEIKTVIENTEKEEGTTLSNEEVKQIQANVQQQVQDNGITITNDDIAPVKTSNTTTRETNSNLPVEVLSNTLNTVNNDKITKSIEELQKNLKNAKSFQENNVTQIVPQINTQNNSQVVDNNIFAKQVDEYVNGTYNKNNHMTVLEHTPEILQKLGVKDLPITLTSNKLDRIMNDSGKQKGEYHGLHDLVKKIPDALQNPLDIVKSHNNSYVLTTDLSDNKDRTIIASIKIDGKGYIDNVEIDANVMTSAYGRNNYESWMNEHLKNGNIVYDIDRGIIDTQKSDVIPRLQLPSNNITSDKNVSQNEKNVNLLTKQELDNSSFSLDEEAKRYDDLKETNKIEYFKKDNGDVRVTMYNSNNDVVNQIELYSEGFAQKQLGNKLGEYVYNNATDSFKNISLENNKINSETDYMMAHRPTKSGVYASDISKTTNIEDYPNGEYMPSDVYEHPEWYFQMNEKHSQESMKVLNKIRNNPNAEVTIYRATTGDKINKGDWVTLSKEYAKYHNESQFNGKGNIVEKKVKATDIQYAGDDINEWGYFPTKVENQQIQDEIAPVVTENVKDNTGKEVPNKYQKKLKDSKVRDENGNLIRMYHGSPDGTIEKLKGGTYFTDNLKYAERYKNPGASSISYGKTENNPKIYETYLDIKKPFDINDSEARNIYINEYIKGGNAIGIDPYLSDAEYNKINNIDWTEVEDLKDFLEENNYNYDGIISYEGADGGYGQDVVDRGKSYIPFSENQIINVEEKKSSAETLQTAENTTPTQQELDNLEDARLNKSGSEYASAFYDLEKKYGKANLYKGLNEYKSTGKALNTEQVVKQVSEQVEDVIAPIKESIDDLKSLTKEFKKVKSEISNIKEDLAPIKGYMEQDISLYNQANFDNLEKQGIAPVKNTTPEYQYENDNTGTKTVDSPLEAEGRNIDEVGKRSVKAYQYENPEVKPYFEEAAQYMLNDLNNSIKGERYVVGDISQTGGNNYEFSGSKRQTTSDIAQLRDEFHYSYADIEKGLKAIIEDHGAENIAVAKRIEFMLDERLRNGYKDVDGYQIPSNQEYINLINEKGFNTYSQEAFNNLTNDDIAPVYENRNPNYNSWEEAMIDMNKPKAQKEKYEAITPQKTSNEPKMSRVKTEDIAPVKQPQLKIDPEMDAAFDKFAKSFIDKQNELKERKKSKPKVETKTKSKLGRAWDTFQETMVNRNRQIDNLAKETGNSEIKFKGDRMNNISGEIGGDIFTAQTDNYGNAIGKSLDAPFAEARKQGLDAYFDGYLKNLSNIERHEQGKGSAVVSAEESKALVQAYEEKYPVLKDLANDVYTYNQNMLNNAVENGIIDNEFRNRLISMYGKYVPFYENDMENTPGMNMSPDEIRGSKPIKRAKGGSDANLQSVEQAMMKQTYAWKNAIVKNDLYKEIVNSINDKVSIGGDIRENPTLLSDSLYSDESGKYLTAYVDGQQQTVKIGDELFNELNRDLDKQIRNYEEKLSLVTKPLQKLSQIRGQILTTYNPSFVITNPFKDIQDALLNTKNLKGYAQNLTATMQDSKRAKNINTYANDFKTITGQDITSVTDPSSLTGTAKKLYKKYQGGVMWNRFITSYGTNATSMEYGNNNVDTKAKNKGFLNKIANANDYMEVMFRYPEFKAALKEGKSFTEALYNAREITTNFGRGGTISKAINRNGATFFNTSIQGLDKFVRNFSGENGARGFIGAVSKAAMLGIAPSVLNHLLLGGLGGDADDDYEALPDYVKDNYYVFKRDNGEFIRIPKGRMISVLGSAARRTLELAQGEKNAFEGFLSNAESQVGSTNPLKENIFSPLIQAYGSENGEAWYGGDLVPSRLQDLPAAEQYDESTDELSKLIGKVFNISPYKVNYVIDQYSGGLGDILLPMASKKASNDSDSFGDYLLAPIKDKFVVNSTDDNKFAGELFDMSDELTTKANSSKATDEDKLKNQYINSVKSDMSELYQKKREIQNSDLSKSEKYKQVQEIQDQINQMSKDALNTYEKGKYESNYASFGDTEFYKYKNSDGEESWKQIKEDEADELNSMGLTSSEKNKYFISKTKIGDIAGVYKESKKGLDEDDDDYKETIASLSDDKKESIIDTILKADLPDEAKEYLYSKNYSSEKSLDKITKAGTSIDTYLTFEKDTLRFEADKNEEGKTISGSLNNKYEEYLLNSELSDTDKINLYEHAVLSGFDEEDKYTDYKTIKTAGVDIDTWLSFDSQEFKADKDKNGKSVSGSKKKKVISYVNSLDLSIPQKAMMIRTQYSSFNNYNNQIVQYVEDLDVSYDDKVKMIKGSGMKVSDNGTVSW